MNTTLQRHNRLFPLALRLIVVFLLPGTLLGASQLDSPVEDIIFENTASYESLAFAQRAQDNRLILTPDSCFFYPLGPKLMGESSSTIHGADLNGNKSFETIERIEAPGQKIIWPLMPSQTGPVSIQIYLETANPGAEVIVRFGDLEQTVTTTSSDGTTPQAWNLTANILEAGISTASIQDLEIELVNLNGAPALGAIHRVEVSGAGLLDAFLLRTRWRPWAVHGNFKSSSLTASGLEHDLYIVEMRPDFSAEEDSRFYAPVTTKFGYFGITSVPAESGGDHEFEALAEANFSMWSYSMNESAPPVSERSHLLAVGNSAQVFDGYGHEGSGVKPRGGDPLADLTLERLVLAIRMENFVASDQLRYRTYTGYYWDERAEEWKFYASGRDYLTDTELGWEGPGFATPSSFVEVFGGASTERTGQLERKMDYRGWLRDTDNNWHALDTLEGSVSLTEVRSKYWGSTSDGWLRMRMGGLVHRRWKEKPLTRTIPAQLEQPDYLDAAKLSPLDTLPVQVELQECHRQPDGDLEISFSLQGLTSEAEIKLFHGTQDGLTLIYERGAFPDEWPSSLSLGSLGSGQHTITVPGDSLPAEGFCRLLVEAGDQGRYWTRETGHWANIKLPALIGNSPDGTLLGSASLSHPNDLPISYTITEGNEEGLFSLDPDTGDITLAKAGPASPAPFYFLKIEATLEGYSSWRNRLSVAIGTKPPSLPVNESFDSGSPGDSIAGSNGGSNWGGPWTGSDSWLLGDSDIPFPEIQSNGLQAIVGDQSTSIRRPLDQELTIGSNEGHLSELWVTAILNINEPIRIGHSVRLELLQQNSQVGYFGKKINNTLGFELGSSGWKEISGNFGSVGNTVGTWHFALHLLATESNQTQATLYLVRSSENPGAASPLPHPHTATTTIDGTFSFDTIRLNRHNNTTSSIDEIHLSQSPSSFLVDTDGDTDPDLSDPDDDNDQIPDLTEVLHGMNPLLADGHLDLDGDKVSNLGEILLGSNPNDPGSIPAFPGLTQASPTTIEASYPVLPGRTYELWRSTTLEDDDWLLIETLSNNQITGTAVFTDPTPPSSRAYYRIKAHWP